MEAGSPIQIAPEIEADCPVELDAAVGYLRSAGLSKVASMALLVRKCGLSVADAKAAVHTSEVWADRRSDDDAFHDGLERALKELD